MRHNLGKQMTHFVYTFCHISTMAREVTAESTFYSIDRLLGNGILAA